MSKKIGIAFVGGGGKGAYQIGVWKALRETGLDKDVKAVAGTSVGGLNAAMFVKGDFERARNVWENISPGQVLKWELGTKSFFKETNLKKLILKSVESMDIFDDSKINCWVTAYDKQSVSQLKTGAAPDGNIKILSEDKARYFNMRYFSEDERMQLLLATSALPCIFPPQKIDGSKYRDGGLVDNRPVKPLYEIEKCDTILVFHLNQKNERHNIIDRTSYKDSVIIEIWPEEYQGNMFSGTLDFKQESAVRRMNQGYNENIDLFQNIAEARKKAEKSQNSIEEFAEIISERIDFNADISQKLRNITSNWNTEKLFNLQKECMTLLHENKNRNIQLKSVKSKELKDLLAQTAANQYGLNRTVIFIQQLIIDRIDFLQCEAAALASWNKIQDARLDVHEFLLNCSNQRTVSGEKYADMPVLERILFISDTLANITHGTIPVSDESFETACQNLNLTEKIKLSDLYSDRSESLSVLNSSWNYNDDSISDFCKSLYMVKNGDSPVFQNKEVKTAFICQELYFDIVNLRYIHQQSEMPEIKVEIDERKEISMSETHDWLKIAFEQDIDVAKSVYKHAYTANKSSKKERKRDKISQECLDFIKKLCNESDFCKPDNAIFELLKINKDDCLLCHDDTDKSHARGFVLNSEGIYSYIDTKRQNHFISFEEFAEINNFIKHKHINPLNSEKFIEADINRKDLLPILPYEEIKGGSQSIIPFLETIRNACWVDLYL